MAAVQDSQPSGRTDRADALSGHRSPLPPPILPDGAAQTGQGAGQAPHPGLAAAVETRILPWMVLAHRTPNHAGCCCDAAGGVSAADIAALADEARRNDLAAALARVECLWQAGLPLDRLYLELVGPAAVRLGQMWHDDTASMAEVTVGLACLQRLIHALGPAFHQDDLRPDPKRRILLAPMPGEQHSFALVIIAEFLRRAGWDVDCGRVLSLSALCALLKREWFALVGLSVSCTGRVDAVGGVIHALRAASRNRSLGVLVGGPMFVASPDLVAQVGADAMAVDARHAVAQAESLLSLLAPVS
ncbi:cobalamin B12-binding domain-containing protein [Elioraea thermophila]|uniref:cobalamin B12-binding domain-containing protein n=1 Tax=Elioraea thermophila TaxID=2185104 RepID=UPI000DF46A06|nr:cobalamin-dependent protein [Elioraea thermophila]